jgi:hypothetical protein
MFDRLADGLAPSGFEVMAAISASNRNVHRIAGPVSPTSPLVPVKAYAYHQLPGLSLGVGSMNEDCAGDAQYHRARSSAIQNHIRQQVVESGWV